jgi:hypothetical protein
MLALLVALGGTATALSGSNTVFSDDIVNGHVRTADVLNNNVTGADINESTLAAVPNAQKVGGATVRSCNVRRLRGSPKMTSVNLGGLRLDTRGRYGCRATRSTSTRA